MKTLKVKSIFFSLLAVIAVAIFLTSCEQDSIVVDEIDGFLVESSIDEELAEWTEMAEEKNVVVEHATLEEINLVMVEYGLEPFSQEDLEEAVQLRMTWSCQTWNFLGDWNNSGHLSTLDLALAQQYLCNTVGCNGTVNTSSNNFPTTVLKFRWMSYLGYGFGQSLLNRDDIDIARMRILGIIACN